MKKSLPFLITVPVLLAGVFVIASFLYSPPSSAKPSVSWAPDSLSVVVGAGQSTTTSATFTTSESASNVTVQVVPALASYVSVSPSSFPNVTKGASYTIALTVSAATSAPLGVHDGTLHVRQGTSTLARPLPVSIDVVWQAFDGGEELGFSIQYPPGWYVTPRKNAVMISNVTERGELDETTLQTESFFMVRLGINENPLELPIKEWFDQFMRPVISETLLLEDYRSISGFTAAYIETSAVGGRRAHIYMLRDKDVIEVSYGLFAPRFIADYEAMLQSLTFSE